MVKEMDSIETGFVERRIKASINYVPQKRQMLRKSTFAAFC